MDRQIEKWTQTDREMDTDGYAGRLKIGFQQPIIGLPKK